MAVPNKLPLVQRVLLDVLDELQPNDTVSIVTYAVATRVPLRPTSHEHRGASVAQLPKLQAAGRK